MKIFKILLLIFLSSSVQSFEDIYLECGKEEGYFNIVFGFTQSLKDRVTSSRSFEETIDAQVATAESNDFSSGYSSKGRASEDYIYIGNRYSISRIDGKAYNLKTKYFTFEQKQKNLEICLSKKSNMECMGVAAQNSYTQKNFLGNCSVISQSTAAAYANKLFTPKPVERKF